MNIMTNFNENSHSFHFNGSYVRPFNGVLVTFEERMEKVLENHKQYLIGLKDFDASPPLIVNAFVLELIDIVYTYR